MMKYTLTLIGDSLHNEHVEAAHAMLPQAAAPIWLARGKACDITFESEGGKRPEAALRAHLAKTNIDLAIQPAEGRRKKLLIADMDSTIIQQECIDELAAELGLKAQISAITERAMRGEIAFEPALRERVGLLQGLTVEALERVYRNRITETPGGRMLVHTMREHGHACALVSGGFTFFTERVAHAVGFNTNQANKLTIANGKLTGGVAEPILGREAKIEALLKLRDELGLKPHETMAVGDGANDLGMIEAAGLGVAFHAKPVVAEAADARIDHGDLTALLYLQGYTEDEFASM